MYRYCDRVHWGRQQTLDNSIKVFEKWGISHCRRNISQSISIDLKNEYKPVHLLSSVFELFKVLLKKANEDSVVW